MSKIQITAHTRKLKANWTIKDSEELTESLAKDIREELDREVIWGLYNTIHPGWTHVTLPYRFRRSAKEQEINDWCSQNLKGDFKGFHEKWMFELPEDATWFRLRWFNEEKQQ